MEKANNYYDLEEPTGYTWNELFWDFALKSGKPIITDYSLLDRKIDCTKNEMMLGAKKNNRSFLY